VTRLQIPDTLTLSQARDRVRALPGGEDADLNHFFRPSQGDTPDCTHENCAEHQLVGWPPDLDCATAQPIGLIDTGVNPAHDILAAASIDLTRLADPDLDPSAAIHGTAVVSLLVGDPNSRVPGLLPGADIVAVDIFSRAGGDERADVPSLLAGLDLPSSGSVVLAGNDLAALDEDQRARVRAEHVGFVFQSFQLLDSLNALENVMLPLELEGHADARQRARALLERVGLGQRLTHYPRQLSGGEQQRVAIARAFAAEPAVLFADEPTGNLDSHTGERISDLLFELNKERGATLVLVTHDERLAHRCQRLIRLEGGHLVDQVEP
jgi:putative ABC transport system ATP-binding protein